MKRMCENATFFYHLQRATIASCSLQGSQLLLHICDFGADVVVNPATQNRRTSKGGDSDRAAQSSKQRSLKLDRITPAKTAPAPCDIRSLVHAAHQAVFLLNSAHSGAVNGSMARRSLAWQSSNHPLPISHCPYARRALCSTGRLETGTFAFDACTVLPSSSARASAPWGRQERRQQHELEHTCNGHMHGLHRTCMLICVPKSTYERV